ncbi:hypothetical protein LINGRAHAP2_LOCUS14838 [Linum grandiflorum]
MATTRHPHRFSLLVGFSADGREVTRWSSSPTRFRRR